MDKHISDEELRQFYRAADAFVLPSRGEGWGRLKLDLPSSSTLNLTSRYLTPKPPNLLNPPNLFSLYDPRGSRPHVEAMAMGLPIIATNWSASTEYMTPDNSYPLEIEGLTEIKTGSVSFNYRWTDEA